MSDNPNTTLARTKSKIDFCLAVNPKNNDLICTRINHHKGHCCDEITGAAWTDRGQPYKCPRNHDHSKEKGLAP